MQTPEFLGISNASDEIPADLLTWRFPLSAHCYGELTGQLRWQSAANQFGGAGVERTLAATIEDS